MIMIALGPILIHIYIYIYSHFDGIGMIVEWMDDYCCSWFWNV